MWADTLTLLCASSLTVYQPVFCGLQQLWLEDVTGSWKGHISFTCCSLCPPWCGDGWKSTPWLVVSLSHVQTSWNGSHRKDGRLSCEGTYTSLLNWQCSLGRQGTVCDNMMLTFHFYEMIVEQNNRFDSMIHRTVRVLLWTLIASLLLASFWPHTNDTIPGNM